MSTELTGKELMLYRTKLLREAATFGKPDRIPYRSNVFTWLFLDSGYTVAEGSRDYDIMYKCVDNFLTKYKVDAISGNGLRNPFRLTDALGGSLAYTDSVSENLNVGDEPIISAEDYDAIIKDWQAVIWEKATFNKFPKARSYTPQQMAAAAKEFVAFGQGRAKIVSMMEEHGAGHGAASTIWLFYESLFNFYRGIKALSIDLRRCPEKLEEVCSFMDEELTRPVLEKLSATDTFDPAFSADICIPMLGHTILNRKQFDKLMAPTIKRVCDTAAAHGKHVFFFSEGSFIRLGDFLNSFDKGTVSMMVEQDDPFEIRAKYPNIGIYGGLSVSVMGHGTPEECVDMVKKCIDKLGRDGGYVLMENKMVSFSYDMRSENLKAVADYVAAQ